MGRPARAGDRSLLGTGIDRVFSITSTRLVDVAGEDRTRTDVVIPVDPGR